MGHKMWKNYEKTTLEFFMENTKERWAEVRISPIFLVLMTTMGWSTGFKRDGYGIECIEGLPPGSKLISCNTTWDYISLIVEHESFAEVTPAELPVITAIFSSERIENECS